MLCLSVTQQRIVTITTLKTPSTHLRTFQATKGKLKLTFDKFNVEWSSSCKKKDYLYVGNVSFVNILQILNRLLKSFL